jgi:hypothetical protein
MQIENGRKGSRPFWLVNSRHQHPAGAVAPKLDFGDRKIELGGGIIRGGGGCMSGAGPECARSGQAHRAQLENVTPSERAFVQVLLPSKQFGLRLQ